MASFQGNIISLFLHCVFLNRRKIVVKRNTMWKYDVSPVPHQISLLGFITWREKCRIINLNFSFSLLSPPYVRLYFTWFRIALFFDTLKKFFKTSIDILDDCQRNDKVANILMERVMGKVDESLFSEEETSSQSSEMR